MFLKKRKKTFTPKQNSQKQFDFKGVYSQICLEGVYAQICLKRVYIQICLKGVYAQICLKGVYTQICLKGVYAQICLKGVYTQICLKGVYTQICLKGVIVKINLIGNIRTKTNHIEDKTVNKKISNTKCFKLKNITKMKYFKTKYKHIKHKMLRIITDFSKFIMQCKVVQIIIFYLIIFSCR